jgi:hypothetical protein
VFQNKVYWGGVFGTKRNKVIGKEREIHDEEHWNFYLFATTAMQALGSGQPPIQRVLG